MSAERTRERIIELIAQMRNRTVDRGCTPAEAAGFAAKVAAWIEKYAIEEAELRQAGDASVEPEEMEVCQNTFRTGKRVFNPGVNQVFNGLAQGMCCQLILLHNGSEAVYGVVGDALDADYVCQIASTVIPALQVMSRMEGIEHGYEKAGLIRWGNQYLTGAGYEIRVRLEKDRKDRSDAKQVAATRTPGTGLAVITGESIAVLKRAATTEGVKKMYPRTKTTHSRSEYNHAANEAGRKAGRAVNLNLSLE